MSGNDVEIVSMEEGRTEKIVTKEQAGETSESSDQIIEKGKQLSNIAKENLRCLKDLLIDVEEPTTKTRNPRVPKWMRNNQNMKKYLEPGMVSIGPYHHESKNLEVTQEMKHKLAATFIKEHGVNMEDVYLDILKEIMDLRKCYELDAIQHYNDDDLAWIFLIDGCVVLLYICSRKFYRREYHESKRLEIIKGIRHDVKFTMDLLLLENQLPYRVLKLLVNASQYSEKLEESIELFIVRVSYNRLKHEVRLPTEEPPHLLDLMRTSLIQPDEESSLIVGRLEQYKIKFIEMLSAILWYLIIVLAHVTTLNVPACRNIMELKEAGIKLKCSGTCYLKDISFSGGTLKLPSILINKLTEFKFYNLVAHELSLDPSSTNFEVSAYLYFLSTLIVGVEDVKELRINKILVNYDVQDKEIVKLFKEIRANHEMFGALARANYRGVREEIHDYCNKSYNAWIAQLKNKYFESPWSAIAMVGAIVALSVTILQTIYTILAYYKEGTP